MVKVVHLRFRQCLVALPCCLLMGPLKGEFLDIYFTKFFVVRNFGNTPAMRVIFLLQIIKFSLSFKNAEKN